MKSRENERELIVTQCLLSSFQSGWVLLPVSMDPQLELPLFRHFLRSPAVPDF